MHYNKQYYTFLYSYALALCPSSLLSVSCKEERYEDVAEGLRENQKRYGETTKKTAIKKEKLTKKITTLLLPFIYLSLSVCALCMLCLFIGIVIIIIIDIVISVTAMMFVFVRMTIVVVTIFPGLVQFMKKCMLLSHHTPRSAYSYLIF